MKIDLSQVLSRADYSDEQTGDFEISSLELSGSVISLSADPYTVYLTNEGGIRLGVRADVTVHVKRSCDRCLEEVLSDHEVSVDEVFDIADESVVSDPDEDGQWFSEDVLDADRMIADELLLMLPPKALCREDCKGLCPVCGTNLNTGSCQCDRQVLDPRMARILEVFSENNDKGAKG